MDEIAYCDVNELFEVVRAIKRGDIDSAIFSLRRAFADDIEDLELIESEWRKQ